MLPLVIGLGSAVAWSVLSAGQEAPAYDAPRSSTEAGRPFAVDVWPLSDEFFERLGSLTDPTTARDLGSYLRREDRAYEDDGLVELRRVVFQDVGERPQGELNPVPQASGLPAVAVQIANNPLDDVVIDITGLGVSSFSGDSSSASSVGPNVIIPTPSTAATLVGLLGLAGLRRPGSRTDG